MAPRLRQGNKPRTGGVGPTAGNAATATQGTLGGKARVGVRPGGIPLQIGDEGYLWVLVALEVLAITWGRRYFRRFHGG